MTIEALAIVAELIKQIRCHRDELESLLHCSSKSICSKLRRKIQHLDRLIQKAEQI